MKLISWNVAGYRACVKKGFPSFFTQEMPDIFALQEVKATLEELPYIPENYYLYINPALKKGYSGTMIFTKEKPISVSYGINKEIHDQEGRVITLEYPNIYLVNVYVPNAKQDLSRLEYRTYWEKDFLKYINKLHEKKKVIICGDFNVANEEIDLKNAKENIGNAGFTYEERNCFKNLLNNNYVDTYRYLYPNEVKYTWWNYITKARERNVGWRIDYFIVSKDLTSKIKNAIIYSDVLGSDHCPIGLIIDL